MIITKKQPVKLDFGNQKKLFSGILFHLLRVVFLELGCGVGRISFSLWMLGYNNLTATDISRKMIKRALKIHHERKTDIVFYDEDATALKFDRDLFEGIIFGFNGLMQIPENKNRKKAIRECYRVLKPGGHFVFTTHDRSVPKWKKFLGK